MKVEEDIKEIKNNFFRVMHCAFAKYEEGFKRKNEYLERRRIKKREEIERGVAKELEKRKISALADQAAREATPEVSSEDENEFEGHMNEKRFLKSMARQDREENDELERQEIEDKKKKRRTQMLQKQKAILAKKLQELEDPDNFDKAE